MSFSRASGWRACCANTRSSENSPVVSATLAVADLERARGEVERCGPNATVPSSAGAPGATRSPCRRSTAWMRATSSRGLNGLREVVVGAHLEADDAIDVLALGGQHDDRHRLAGAAQAPAHGKAVLAGQHEVEHDQVRRVALQLLVEVARVGQRAHLEALFAEIAGQQVAQAHVVVDDENLRWVGLRRHVRCVGERAQQALRSHHRRLERIQRPNSGDATVSDCNVAARAQRPVAIEPPCRRTPASQSDLERRSRPRTNMRGRRKHPTDVVKRNR